MVTISWPKRGGNEMTKRTPIGIVQLNGRLITDPVSVDHCEQDGKNGCGGERWGYMHDSNGVHLSGAACLHGSRDMVQGLGRVE